MSAFERIELKRCLLAAARAGRNGSAVGAGAGMSEEGADFVGGLGREDVFELAGLLLDFRFAVHGEAIGEEALGEAMTADDGSGALAAARGEVDDEAAVAEGGSSGAQGLVAGIHKRLVIM